MLVGVQRAGPPLHLRRKRKEKTDGNTEGTEGRTQRSQRRKPKPQVENRTLGTQRNASRKMEMRWGT
jgi:hypothetical protein